MENEPKLCPFKKISYAIDVQRTPDGNILSLPLGDAYALDEDFKPCVQERCMAYRNGDCALCQRDGVTQRGNIDGSD
jgi:hypothetical protein